MKRNNQIPERTNEHYVVSAEFQLLKIFWDNPDIFNDHPEVTEEEFVHKTAKTIFVALATLIEDNENINPYAVLTVANKIDASIDIELIEQIEATEADASNFNTAWDTLQKESIKYKVTKKLQGAIAELSKMGGVNEDSVQSLLWDSQQLLINLGEEKDLQTAPECLDDYLEDMERRKRGDYYSFGDAFLDEHLTRKASGGQIILISAATGMGKSMYALNLINGMVNLNIPAMYVSLEMDKISTYDRWLAMRTQIPLKDWYEKDSIEALKAKVIQEQKNLEGKPFRFVENPSISLTKLQSLIREFKSIYKTDYVCVYIDLITQVKEFIDLDNGGGSLANTIEGAVNKLNAIAKLENVCFVCVAQMKRTIDDQKITKIEDTGKLKPTLGGIKNSGALAERSRVVLGVFRARPYIEKYLPDDPKLEYIQDIMEVNVLKQNQGGNAHGKYLFEPTTMTAFPYKEEESTIKF